MKVIIVGDLHIYNNILDIFERLLDEVTSYNYPIVFLGDIFHYKHKVTVPFLLQVQKILNKHKDRKMIIIDGNHDFLSDNLSINSLFSPQIKVYSVPTIDDFMGIKTCFFPYIPAEKIDLEKKYDCDLVFSHLFLEGSSYKFVGIKEIPISIFPNAKLIFNGHIHAASTYKNVVFSGSIYSTNYSEKNNRHFYYIFDTDTFEYETVEIAYLQMVETDGYNPMYNTPEYIVYYTGDIGEAAKYTNVRRLIMRNVVKLEEVKEKEQAFNDIYAQIKRELSNYLITYDNIDEAKIPKILELLPTEMYFKLYNKKSMDILTYLKTNVANFERFIGDNYV